MKKLLVVLLAVTMLACNTDEIESLQKQVDELEQKQSQLEQNQAAMEAALNASIQAAINDLRNQIGALEAADAAAAADLADLLTELSNLQADLTAESSKVYWGNLVTDADFAAFKDAGNSVVSGYVVVSKDSHVQALTSADVIGGGLYVEGTTSFVADNLAIIGEDMIIKGNDITMLSVPALASIGGDFEVMDNAMLTDVAMPALALVAGDFTLNNYFYDEMNYADVGTIVTVDFSGLVSVAGNLTLDNLAVVDVHFPALTSVWGDFALTNDAALSTLDFSSLTEIDGDLTFQSNTPSAGGIGIGIRTEADPLSILNHFNSLVTVDGDISIMNNGSLSEIIGFDALTSAGAISVEGHTNLSLFDAFNVMEDIAGFAFKFNGSEGANMILDGFSAAVSAGDVEVIYNDGMSVLTGFESVETAANITMDGLPALTTLDAFAGLTKAGLMVLSGLPNITDLNGFNAVTELEGLHITYNSGYDYSQPWPWPQIGMEKISGFAALEKITYWSGGLVIDGNGALTTIEAFDALTTSYGPVTITGNSGLTSITGFSLLSSVSQTVNIETYDAGLCAFKPYIDARMVSGWNTCSFSDANGTWTEADADQAVASCQ